MPEPRVVIANSEADPFVVGSRIAFSRRVGLMIGAVADVSEFITGKRVRFRSFDLLPGLKPVDPVKEMKGIETKIDLINPQYEVTLVRGRAEYLSLTSPASMMQGWSRRKPRSRAFFHPSAIFPKLSRALVNLSSCKAGDLFLDPFAGTGSIPIEAAEIGARVVASDQVEKMARGSLANMKHFGQEWLGVIRADAFHHPILGVDAIATDVPYGRLSSTRGAGQRDIIDRTLSSLPAVANPGARIVLMHPKQLQVAGTSDLQVEEELHLYVHRFLTRTMTILRRK